jgi:hypothetical protein
MFRTNLIERLFPGVNHSKWFIAGLFLFGLFLTPKISQAATIYVSPGSGNYGVGSTFTVNIAVNTQSQTTNTAEARVSYTNLDVVSVRQGSTYYLSSPGSPSKGSGTVYFGGGLPTPGYNGNGGIIGSITFRAKAEGVATVSVDSGKVLLNDGLGTDALSGTSGARFTIVPPPVGSPIVTSGSHPSSEGWYNKTSLTLSWSRPNEAYGFSFELDQDPNTVPDNTLDTTITTTKTYEDLKDGAWYFHIKARPTNPSSSFGATTHFKVQIDTIAPENFDVSVAESTINYDAKDLGSGIDRYEVFADGKKVEGDKSPVTIFGLKDGQHQITVTAYDKAGNKRDAKAVMEVHGVTIGFFQRSIQIPLYLLIVINFVILLLITLIIWLIFRRRNSHASHANEISTLQSEIDELKKEYAAAAELNKKITKTKRKIDSKLKVLKK